MWKFEPEDFRHSEFGTLNQELKATEMANAKLKEWIEASPMISLLHSSGKWFIPGDPIHFTHTARLICIEPIKKDTAEDLLRGSHADNTKDKVSKNRQAKGVGNGRSTLSESDVLTIIQLIRSGEPRVSIARRYGVDCKAIYSIEHGHTWKHITKPD